ncbi:non-ribosomal peptide synthetase [Podospora didyma]|uniref:Non-ribosomal peptide synthetase n=1 Tax=Podospora didyma TaxID=330526 RepID=A0AAE0N353_9PEZI|nr:non-ribosomal peptide synthetase [Podospora didyma]
MNTTDMISDWAAYLTGATPCRFPRFSRPVDEATRRPIMSARVDIEMADTAKLLSLSTTTDPDGLIVVLQAAWALLLHCYTGQDDVSFGFQHNTADPIVARFVLNDCVTVTDAVGHAKANMELASRLPPLPAELSHPTGKQPLFDTAMVLWGFGSTTPTPSFSKASYPSLRLLGKKHGETSLSLFLEWNSHIGMARAHGALVASTLARLLSSLLTCSPNAQIGTLDCMSRANQDQVQQWNNEIPIQTLDRCVHHVIVDQVHERPEAEAVCAWDGSFSFQQLDVVTNRLAAQLVKHGVGPEIFVPLCFDKSKWTVVAMIAVLKAGAAFVPLDPSHPVERLRGLFDDAAVAEESGLKETEGTLPSLSSANAAYVIFTSGSTGKPKGTVIEHRAFCSGAKFHGPALRIDGTCRVLQFAAHTFDASLVEILTPLMVGACVCIPSEYERLNDITGAIGRMRVNHATLTPSFIGFLMPESVPTLRRLVLAGEAMAPSHVATWSHIELINGYGPAECSVAAVVNSSVGPNTEPKDIGTPCGVRVWLVDPADHDRLVPVGCVGEMLFEGPTLARGYVNDLIKTEESFIFSPAWARDDPTRRFYKTGDLGRYNSVTGSLTYVGRKDTQIKFHGQRIELGEIEHHLAADKSVKHAMVLLPKLGPLAQRLIVVLSLSDRSDGNQSKREAGLKLTNNPSSSESTLAGIRERLGARLPAYMVPSTWLCVEALPMLPSRKMDRKAVSTWIESVISTEQSQKIIMGQTSTPPSSDEGQILNQDDESLTDVEVKLCKIWGLVLNLPLVQIKNNVSDRSFLSLGGDSISAMSCASHAKKAQLGVSVQEVLRAKSLRQLAEAAKPLSEQNKQDSSPEVEDHAPFDLTPIQQMHFKTRGEAQGDEHFNQSFCLRLTRHTDAAAVRNALEVVIKRHAMLRARFTPVGKSGQWRQFITTDIQSSYRFRAHEEPLSTDQTATDIASAQGCLNVRQGPLFATELFAIKGGDQILFMTIHHLVIDLVSWRVILEEVEDILEGKMLGAHPSLSFQRWAAMQMNDARSYTLRQVLPAASLISPAEFAYWGMHDRPNLYGDVVCQNFEIDVATSSILFEQCHAPFRTETIDLLLAALIWSFHTSFPDRRPAPAIFNEGHGREPPSEDIDISRTIGWFTTLFPVALSSPTSFTDTLVQIKDIRRQVPGNGRPYLAARFFNNEAQAQWGAKHTDMEISFNFLGRYQQLERTGALFQPAVGAHMAGEAHAGSPTADFGRASRRFALFEVSAVIIRGALRFGFAWNRGMAHQTRIPEWVVACESVLKKAAVTLPTLGCRITPNDLRLLPALAPEDLKLFESTKLPVLTSTRGWDAIEDIYPTSPIQQGLLVSRTKDGDVYAVRRTLRLQIKGGGVVDSSRLVQAWRGVVQHHALLRTVFVDALSQNRAGSHDQVVLKDVEPLVLVRRCPGTEDEMLRIIQNMEPMQYQDGKPQHRLSVISNNETIICVLEMSHAIMDGASMDVILRDLGRSYNGSLSNLPRPLFSPFVASLQQRNTEADAAFWTSHLAGLEPCHFPKLNDGINVAEAERQLLSIRVALPGLADLRAMCDEKGVTLPNAFHAAWALTLACYTGTDDVCFGYLVSGRDAALVDGSEDAVGPFINMATQRVKLDNQQQTLLHVLEAIQADNIECMPFAQASLAEIQHALRVPGGMALFNTCISYRRLLSPKATLDNGALVWDDWSAIHDPTEYPISLNVEMDDNEAIIDLDYWTDAVATGNAEHVAATFQQALSNMTQYVDTPICEVELIHQSTMQRIWDWNANMPATTVDCLHRMVERQVALRPQAQAIRGWDGDFSYEEMNTLANCFSSYLVSLGVGPEVFVPVCFDKSAWTTIAMLAVLKAGGAVVPLDASHPAEALESKVSDAGAHVVVSSETRASLFQAVVPYVVTVGPESSPPIADNNCEILSDVSPEDPAWIMFTSGSTGKPKGVVLCHQALASSTLAHGTALGLGSHTRFLQFAAHTFDNSIEEMFTTLVHGGCVCVPSEADRLGDLPGAIEALGANFMDLTPTVATLLRPDQVPSIRGMAVGGEALTQEVLDAWGGHIPIHNQYGPSECSINATHRLHTDARGDVANIGTSVGSVSWVTDPRDHNRLLPIGCVGELLIDGPILARGYMGRPVETAKAFIELPKWASMDPHLGSKGNNNRKMYKTGDLVRHSSDGSLVYLGRKDSQIKLHGQRIEPGEIEHHVKTSLPPAAQSSVELVSLARSQKALAVFICTSPSSGPNEIRILPMDSAFASLGETIVGAMATQLPSYMIPSLFFSVSRMPMTSSGKLDRRRLRAMALALSESENGASVGAYRLGAKARNLRAPETTAERLLQQLWSAVLHVDTDSIGADDSFFRHGGDSVGAMRLVAAARQRGVILAVANIFQTPKLSDLARTAIGAGIDIESVRDGDGVNVEVEDEVLPGPTAPFSMLNLNKTRTALQALREQIASICCIDVDSIEDIYPASQLQAGLVAASQSKPGAYVAVNAYELPAGADVQRFKRAWQDVVDAEAILRTRVVFVDSIGKFMQIIVRGEITWTTAADVNELGKNHRHLPPHDGGILSRYTIASGHTHPVFVWTAHHALYDGWSLSTLLSRVEARYRRPDQPMLPTPHYSRFVEHICGIDVAASDTFWITKLSGSAPQQFPQLPHTGYRVRATNQACRSVRFARPESTDLTLASFFRAAWALVVSIYSSSDDVVFGEVLNGRDVPVIGIEHLVGPTLTTVPRRIRIDRSLSIQSALADLQTQLNDVIPHQFSGLQRIKSLSPEAAAACDFQNLLVLDMANDAGEEGSLWSNLVSGGNTQGADFFSYPLNVTCNVGRGGKIEMRAYFDGEVVPQWQVNRMLGEFETVLQRISAMENQQDLVSDIDLTSPDDAATVREWNREPGPLIERRVHDMIIEKMQENSTATAVIGWDATLSNGELHVFSTALARELLSKGIGGSNGARFVPFCFEKSTFATVAMLAILKAGAAFVPLDPAHPVARLREIVGDCEASAILCSPKFTSLCKAVVNTVVPVDLGMLQNLKDGRKLSIETEVDCQPSDPAYVIFTSGTTGKPKGTIVSHTAFCSGATAHGPAMLMSPPFRFLQFASYTFDACLIEILTTLMMGGTVCVPREADRTNGNIAAAMEEMGVTMTLLTPSFARTLKPADVPSLKTLILGGEAMTQSHVDVWSGAVNLVNAYGPSECAVVATVNPEVRSDSNPANLGRGLGRCWIVDPKNHERLAPLGSVGELLVEGPTLSTGYLRNEAKTREVFIESPRWAQVRTMRYSDMPAGSPRRMYKTGDLVRVSDDVSGEMTYMGRKDASQSKLNGQRLELDEIVHHILAANDNIRHAVALLPKEGPCVKRLVAVISLRQKAGEKDGGDAHTLELVSSGEASSTLNHIQNCLREKLPPYMIPSTWLAVKRIPLLPSGKLDRPSLVKFVEGMDDEIFDTTTAANSTQDNGIGTSGQSQQTLSIDERLRAIWCEVLNITPDRVGKNVSFLHLGGDSITAIQVMARCRAQGISIAVHDITSSRSVHDLAMKASVSNAKQVNVTPVGDEDYHEFDLSPIQQLYLHQLTATHPTPSSPGPRNRTHFNQSVLLRMTKDVNPDQFERGLQALVETHSMLRARFRRDGAGSWRQRLTKDVSTSYRLKTHTITNKSRMETRIQNSQRVLDIQKGPLLAADWFTVGKEKEVCIFITAHHLVVDIISWGILLQDLEDFFAAGKIMSPASLSFQTWTRNQSEQAQAQQNGPSLLPHHGASKADLEYWGMPAGTPNVYGDVVTAKDVELDPETTTLLLGPECHAPLQTDVLDVLMAVLLLSYRSASEGRKGPSTIYNEGHGREVWDNAMDLSRTVGWFTTLYPVHLPEESTLDDDVINAVRWVKDYRERLTGKGRPYFAYRLLTSEGREQFEHGWPVEVAFNYLGQMQQMSRTDTVLQSMDSVGQTVNFLSDIGKDVPRFSLIEVSAVVAEGRMKLSFAYNRHMKHRDKIVQWAEDCQALLCEATRRLVNKTPEKTLSAFPLLPLAYYGAENLGQRLQDIGIDVMDVEDAYPCSPTQRGLLLSQMREPDKYAYKAIFEIRSSQRRQNVDPRRLCDAWQSVVKRHSTLRTIFVDTVGDEGLMDQVVLRSSTGRVQLIECDSHGDQAPTQALAKFPSIVDYKDQKPPHGLAVCITPTGRVFCRLEISHAICDGSSLPILLSDLADAYDAESGRHRGSTSKRPVPPYREYMAYIHSQPRVESVGYWKDYLNGAEPCLFPTLADGDGDAEPSLGSHALNLDHVGGINAYCANAGITLSMLLQFVWGLVLRSYTGSDEVLFGYLASGRDVPVADMEHAIGAFINMLVCRLVLPTETELGEALDTMRSDLADAISHQSCSLAEMQHELHLAPGAALFNTAFTYQKRATTKTASQKPALEYSFVSAEDPSEYTVAVNVESVDNEIEVGFSYWRNVISDAQIKNIADTFEQVLKDIITSADDSLTVGEVRLIGSAGVHQIRAWNDYELPRVDECVHDIITGHASNRPLSTPAVCGWDASFTYRELDTVTTTVAYHLADAFGITGPDVFVPLCFEKSAWTVVAQIAVLKAGGAFVNLDPAHPDSRLTELVQDVGAKLVLCSSKHKAKMDKLKIANFVLNARSIAGLDTKPNSLTPPSRANPSSAAYVIFTSGTTGKPKGTVIEHAAIATGGISHAKAMFMHSDSRVLQFASYTFDASIMETLSCLLVGGCVCVPSDEDRINDVAAVIRNMGVTWTLLTPSVAGTVKPETVPGLKTLVTGGEAMASTHIARWGTRCALVNAYGPTECSVVATTSIKVDESLHVCNSDASNIGPAVTAGRIWVVDPHSADHLVPVGAIGELVVEGRLVARGYLNNDQATSRAFIRSPPEWASLFPQSLLTRQDPMYRTGDLVRYNSDGSVSYVSRKDTQVKLNGRRIELGEIESNCRGTGLVADDTQTAVEVVNSRGGSKSLAVFFTNGTPATNSFTLIPLSEPLRKIAHAMQTHLAGVLPTYMVPQLFVPVSAMPWTTAGKLDRRQLRQAIENSSQDVLTRYRLSSSANRRHRAPASEMEKKLQGLWESVLGLTSGSVGAGDSFFAIGGDSLTAMRLVGTARAHRLAISVLDVFEKPVLADMALVCSGGRFVEATSDHKLKPFDLVPCPRTEVDTILSQASAQCCLLRHQIQDMYPCSPLQEGLVALANKQNGAYVAVNILKLPSQINLDRFKTAWQQVVDETDTLRTRIVHTDAAGFMQVVASPEPINWHRESALDEAVAIGKRLGSQNGGSLTQYTIVDGVESGRCFVWAIHHALYDGWSLPLIVKRAQDLYNGYTSISGPSRPSYAGFIQYLAHRDMVASEQFWRDSLDSASSITHFPQLPSIVALDHVSTFKSETRQVKLSRSDILADITVPTLIRAAWAIVLSAYTAANDVVFGETLAGRNVDVQGVMEMAGPTFTTIPTRVRLPREMRLVEFLRKLHGMGSRLAAHQHLGLQHIKKLNSDCAAACGFQNLLTIQNSSLRQEEESENKQGMWDFEGSPSTDGFFTHPLVLECNVSDKSIEATFHYDENVISPWHTKRLVHQLEAVIKRLAEKSNSMEAVLADIDAISPEDHALVTKWNRTNTPFGYIETAVESCIHHLFENQAGAQPERIGIRAWDAELTYGEILNYASRLSAFLGQAGVREETLVPVCLARSAWAVVTLLGILMAGGAFVPLDPAHPLPRYKEMLEAISPSLVVCSPEHSSRFSGIVGTCLSVDGDMIRNLPSSLSRNASVSPLNTAYVLFTSGSTGRPKGVVVAHRDFCSSSRGYARATKLDASSRVLHFASLTFDVALMEVLTPLTLGACVCVPTADERLHDLGAAIIRLRATWAFLTPSVANLLDPKAVCSGGALKTLVCGGEAMLAETVARWADSGIELMNGYGPTEASVLAVVNPHVSRDQHPGVIGRATGAARAWIVDVRDEGTDTLQRLVPVGAVGELAISGPLLARGYLNDPAKTAQVFIESPTWAQSTTAPGSRLPTRIYRTGDLVRYRPDGALEYLGRRDGQVKVGGQRIELGEIESHLSIDHHVRLALVVQPKTGPFKKQLVGIITLESNSTSSANSKEKWAADGNLEPLNGPPERMSRVRACVAEIKSRLADVLPHYMVPPAWIVLESMPVVVSGKLDRKRVATWVENLDDATHQRLSSGFNDSGETYGEEGNKIELTGCARSLIDIWAKELHLPVDRIKATQPFMSLGGDSITAMGVVSRARNANISISVQDVLRSKSIIHLAQLAKQKSSSPAENNEHEGAKEEELRGPFGLSPIQSMYLKSATKHDGSARFNQSFAFRVPRRIAIDTIKKAMDSIVQRHHMLRARFFLGKHGDWEQRCEKMGQSVYRCVEHNVNSEGETLPIMVSAQTHLDIKLGPVFNVDLIDLAGADHFVISMVAHHLCVDMVSWRIIVQDLNHFLETGSMPVETPLSFQSWCALQTAKNTPADPRALLPFENTPPYLTYWGAQGKSLIYGNTRMEMFILNENMTKFALADCHRAFKSEPTDLFLAAIAHSFANIFKDRNVPTLHIEGHGRESPMDIQVDLSRTVGWFTTICPLAVEVCANDPLETVRRVKDMRHSIPEKGRLYFANKHLKNSAAGTFPLEVLFNYLGGGVHHVDDDTESLIRPAELNHDDKDTADVGHETRRLAIFEISAIVVNSQLQFSFMYDDNLIRGEEVRNWIGDCRSTLQKMIQALVHRAAEPTLSDYPLLLPLTYDGLRTLTKVALPRVGINQPSDVEDIYPCTPVQEGMLISQLRDQNAYIFHGVYKVSTASPRIRLQANNLARAWQKLVNRHAALRTVFIESVRRGGVFDQVVLNKIDCAAVLFHCSNDEVAKDKLNQVTIRSQATLPQLPHRLAICTTDNGKILMKLEINHAAVDGGSLAIILEELALAYAGTLDGSPGPLFSDYIQYIRTQPTGVDTEYWMRYLKGVEPCYFPRLNNSATTLTPETDITRALRSTTLQFDRYAELRRLSEQTHVTLANIMHTAWAFVLRKYTGSDDVCFGYLTADRDAPVDNIGKTVGTLINMLCCRIRISTSQILEDVFRTAQEQHLDNLEFQRCSLARVQHELGLGGKALYNTSISTQNHPVHGSERENNEIISFEMEEAYDPSEYAITVNIDTSKMGEGVVFRYWSDHISDDLAQEVADSMTRVLDGFISRSTQSVMEFDSQLNRKQLSTVCLTSPDTPVLPLTPKTPVDNFQPEAPNNPSKNALLALWSALLKLPAQSISGEDSFFDLGGDSITAMKLVNNARDLGLALSVADVFQHPTFDDMATSMQTAEILLQALSLNVASKNGSMVSRHASRRHHLYERFSLLAASNVDSFLQASIVPQVGVFKGGLSDVLPATDFQSLAVAGSMLKSRWMLNYFYLDGQGPVDVSQLKRAAFRVVQTLDILRTVFIPSGGRFLQVVLRTLRPSFHVIDIDNDNEFDSFTNTLQRRTDGEGTGPGEPFVEFTVVKHRHSGRHRILLRISHAQYDGVCFPKILDALRVAYRGETVPRPPSFANYLRASAGSLTSAHYQHWKKLLDGSFMTEIVRRDGPNYSRKAIASCLLKKTVHLPPIETGHITTATVVKAAWAYVLAQLSTSSDVVFGHTISGRNAAVEGVGSMVGPCLNLLPVRVRFFSESGGTAKQLLHQIQDQQVANMPHEVLGFREIIRHCTDWPAWTYYTSTVQHHNIDQSSGLRLGDVEYSVGCASAAQDDFADLSVLSQRTEGKAEANKYDIMLSFAEGGPVPREFAERALDMLCDAARQFATDPNTALPSPAELGRMPRQVPFKDNATASTHPNSDDETCLLHLTQAQQLNMSTRVTVAWRRVLGLPEDAEVNGKSFFALGGDIVGLAQLAWLLSQDNGATTPSLEDLIDHPTVRGHMAVLAELIAATPPQESNQEKMRHAATAGPEVQRMSRVDSSLTKALKLAKKLTRKKNVRIEMVNAPATAA